jgi:hypothetical protein
MFEKGARHERSREDNRVHCVEHDKQRYTAAWDPELWIHALKTAIPIEGAEYCGYKDSGRKHWFIGIVPGEIE